MIDSTRQRRRRRAIRFAVYGGVAVAVAAAGLLLRILGSAGVGTAADEDWAATRWSEAPAVRRLQRYVRIDTSASTGDEASGAAFLAGELAAAGVSSTIERLGDGHANLWAVLEGDDPGAVVLHHHLDVAPITDATAWEHPPFGGTIEGPWIYGRGVFDMKSLAVAQLEAFLALARSGRRPRRSIVLLATGGEETGSELGTRWILRQHPALAARFRLVLTEGGVVEAVRRDIVKYWGIEFAQKRVIWVEACSPSRRRLEELEHDLGEARLDNLRVTPEVRRFLAAYASTRSWYWARRLLAAPDSLILNPTRLVKLPGYIQSLFRNEVSLFPIEEDGHGSFRRRISVLLLPGADPGAALGELLPEWATAGVGLAVGRPLGAAHGSALDSEDFRALVEVVEARYPGTTVGPYLLSSGATDARFYRQAGIPAYGFSPFLVLSTDTLQIDAPNERLALPAFLAGVELYRRLLERLVF